MHSNTYSCIAVCFFVLEMCRAAGRVPQAIKSIFQELQRCCRLLPAALKTNTRGEEWRVGGEREVRAVVGEGEEVRRGGQRLQGKKMVRGNMTHLMNREGWELRQEKKV